MSGRATLGFGGNARHLSHGGRALMTAAEADMSLDQAEKRLQVASQELSHGFSMVRGVTLCIMGPVTEPEQSEPLWA